MWPYLHTFPHTISAQFFTISLLVTFLCHTHTHTHTAFLFTTTVSSQQQRIFSFFHSYRKLHIHTDRTTFSSWERERIFLQFFPHTTEAACAELCNTNTSSRCLVRRRRRRHCWKGKMSEEEKKSEAIPIWYGRFFFTIGKLTLNTFFVEYSSKFRLIHLYLSSCFTFLQTPALYEKLFESFHQGISKFSFARLFTCNCAILTIYDNCQQFNVRFRVV